MWNRICHRSIQYIAKQSVLFRVFGSTALPGICNNSDGLSIEIPVVYESKDIEPKWAAFWQKNVNMRPHPESADQFSMVTSIDSVNNFRFFHLLM